MKTKVRLNSVVPHGVSGPEAGGINLIYEFLLGQYKQNTYSYISINQIGDDLDEVILKSGNQIYINVRYKSPDDFEFKSDDDKNRIRLEVINLGLLRIAAKYKKLDILALEAVKNKILENKFSFELVCKTYKNKKDAGIIAKLVVNPKPKQFDYYLNIYNQEKLMCKLFIYSGDTSGFYVNELFRLGKWKDSNKLILSGKSGEVEIHISIDKCKVEYVNLTQYEKPPFFEIFRSDISSVEKEMARKNYEYSLPPAISAIIRKCDN